jgi:hypothetical protein
MSLFLTRREDGGIEVGKRWMKRRGEESTYGTCNEAPETGGFRNLRRCDGMYGAGRRTFVSF